MRRRFLFASFALVALGFVGLAGVAIYVLRGSLPIVEGTLQIDGVSRPARIDRDGAGIPTLVADSRADLAFATGFAHAQDRFFQMDLLRRSSAGELSELVGAVALETDSRVRVHQFRQRAAAVLERCTPEDRQVLDAYVAGVNAGLDAMWSRPPEYLMLNDKPTPWRPEDTVLCSYAMCLTLEGRDWRVEGARGLIHDAYPQEVARFLLPRGTRWDAPIEGEPLAMSATPSAEQFHPRAAKNSATTAAARPASGLLEPLALGSNNWAVSGSRSKHGGAILADDMHLLLGVPNIWYRAAFDWSDGTASAPRHRVIGVTLPGTPIMIVGSNTRVAWGFTNSEGDWSDLVLVEPDPADPENRYLTPSGPMEFERQTEKIVLKGSGTHPFEVVRTIWGPIVDKDHQGRSLALRWVAHDPAGINFRLMDMETVTTMEEALAVANRCGTPHQNFVAVDDQGRIGWTIMGQIPNRVGFDGFVPTRWDDGERRWNGFLAAEQTPRIVDPPAGRIWTANARVVGGEKLEKIGFSNYDLGARAGQIRDGLMERDQVDESDMLAIQLDDRILFLDHWRRLLLDTLTPEQCAEQPRRQELRQWVERWDGRATANSVGYRLVDDFRSGVLTRVFDPFLFGCRAVRPDFEFPWINNTEGPVWQAVSERPEHLLDAKYANWDQLLLEAVDAAAAQATANGASMSNYTWGAFNTSRIRHPLSAAVPILSGLLDMPAVPMDGGRYNLPRFQMPFAGASQRMAVSPGKEDKGYFHMPGGQSGHFLSPHYADGHAAWLEGKPTPFLPGPTQHSLVLAADPDGK